MTGLQILSSGIAFFVGHKETMEQLYFKTLQFSFMQMSFKMLENKRGRFS